MMRGALSRCRNSRWITIICLASLCMNILLIISTRHLHNDYGVYEHQNSRKNILDKLPFSSVNSSNTSSVRQLLLEPAKEPEIHPIACSLCPVDPPNLLGELAPLSDDINVTRLALLFPEMKSARLQPTDCVARQRTAIIIPYRNRYPHLHILLHNLIPFLTRQQVDATFFVIEQAPPETFNRGALLNVGFLEADKDGTFDCYIFHDVDLIPLDDRHMYRCGDNPKHFAVAMNKYNYKLTYTGYFGGAVGFSRRQFKDINGCSNVYFGWGGEDDDLYRRVLNKGYLINRSPVAIARYDMIKHKRDKGNEANPVRKHILSSAKKRQDVEGLNTIEYKINSVKHDNFYIWINVSLNRTLILQKSPKYVLDGIMPVGTTVNPIKKQVSTVKVAEQKSAQKEYVHEKHNLTTAETVRDKTSIESMGKS